MKKVLLLVSFLSLVGSWGAFAKDQTKEEVTALVQKVCGEIKGGDAKPILDKIISGAHPYKNKDNPAFYAFVYDEKVNIVAHPKKKLVGKNYHGKPDIRGKMFRDKIVEGALKKGKGWVTYTYQKPGSSGEFRKKAYYNLCESGGVKYVVVSGMYDR